MAFVASTPHTLSCARFMATETNSSLMPSQRQRSCYGASCTLHLQVPKAVKASIPSIPYSFSFEIKNPPRSVKATCALSGDLTVVTGETWEEYVLNSDIPVLVEFWASWCGPCRMVHREMEEIAKEYTGKIKCYMIKADEDIIIADKYGVKVVPVVVLFKNGEKRDSVTGTMPNYVYTEALDKLLSS